MIRFVVFLMLSAPMLAFAEPEVYLQVLGIAQDTGYARATLRITPVRTGY